MGRVDGDAGGGVRIGIDIGGTFTDIVAIDAGGRIRARKVSSTVDDYSRGIADGVAGLLAASGLSAGDVTEAVHATTVATNAVLEGRGARTALVTTAGFRDVLEFRRVRVPELYNLRYVKPPPLVPRRLRLEVRERLGADGVVRVALDEEEVRRVGARLAAEGIEAVAICLLHSYANPAHERRVAEILRAQLDPGVFISCSHEILPEMREYERTSTTVVNAFLGPLMARYLAALRGRLDAVGVPGRLGVMQSNGSQMGVAAAAARPAYLVESGPAAGVIAAARIAAREGLARIVTLDIGGTTAKTAIVEDGEPARTSEYEVGSGINLSSRLVKGAGYAVKLPFIDVSEIGAGGGSHVWFDKAGGLKVGPRSAGSTPGPVCYGAGGTEATLTDAMLTLGYINPHHLVGGALALAPDAARAAIAEQVGTVLGVGPQDAALGVYRVAVANMVRAVKSVSTARGRDPRDYTLIAFGGNGPLLAAAIAAELAMPRVLVPPFPGVLSAVGLLVSDTAQEMSQAMPGLIGTIPAERIAAGFAALAARARDTLIADGVAAERIAVTRQADLRYAGQAFELTVAVAGDTPDPQRIAADFHAEHERSYGHKAEGAAVELVAIRVVARVPGAALSARMGAETPGTEAGPRSRVAWFGGGRGGVATPVLSRAGLAAAGATAGPLIVEEYDSTTLIPPGATAHVDAHHNIIVSMEGGR